MGRRYVTFTTGVQCTRHSFWWKVTLPPSKKTLLLLTVGMLTCATKCASAVQCSAVLTIYLYIIFYVTMYCSGKLSLLFVYLI